MGYLEKNRIFVPELRRSLHIAKYRNEQKSARFHIVTYIIQANAQLLDIQSKANLERVMDVNHPFLVKVIFMINRKGLLRDWKTLMTDNDLDLNDLNDLIP